MPRSRATMCARRVTWFKFDPTRTNCCANSRTTESFSTTRTRSRVARRRAHDPRGEGVAEVDAVLAKRHRVVAVRLTELEHLGWRRAAAADKRGQVGAWVRSVVAAELTRRQGAEVPDERPCPTPSEQPNQAHSVGPVVARAHDVQLRQRLFHVRQRRSPPRRSAQFADAARSGFLTPR